MPRSLFGRNLLLFVVLIAIAQIAAALVFRQLIQKPRSAQVAQIAASNLSALKAGLEGLDPEDRPRFIERFNKAGGVQILPATSAPAGGALPVRPWQRLFVRQLRQFAHETDIDVLWQAQPQDTLWLRVKIASEPYWVTVNAARLEAGSLSWATLGAQLAAALLALLGAYLVQRRLNRPLAQLVRAAQQVGRGETPAPLPENTPSEIATVSRSFNRMSANLSRMDAERAIMLAGVSHDLRTPLTKLRLAIEILSEKADPELIAQMTRNVEVMNGIIDQFLDFARAGSAEAPQQADLNALLRECAERFAAQGAVFALDLAPHAHTTFRPQAMQRLVTNLMENALRYAKPDFALRTVVRGDALELSVLDRGPGVNPQDAQRLKRPFTRANEARQGAPGAGLGLAIVDRIARLHGGELQLLARPAGGLEARVTLPLA